MASLLSELSEGRGGIVGASGPHGDNAGRIRELAPACELVCKDVGDRPAKVCQASVMVGSKRVPLKGAAAYWPNKEVSFWMWFEPCNWETPPSDDSPHGTGGVIAHFGRVNTDLLQLYNAASQYFKDNTSPDEDSEQGKLMDYFVLPPQAHCERLGFVTNMSLDPAINWDDEWSRFSGWFKPGGDTGGTPPAHVGEALWPRPLTPSYNPSIRTMPQGFNYDDNSIVPPGFNNPFRGAELWSWAPSILCRAGDVILHNPGEGVSMQMGTFVYEVIELGHTTVTVLHDVIPDNLWFELVSGQYDWRFFNAVIQRRRNWRRWTGDNGHRFYSIDVSYHPMYWDMRNPYAGLPTGLRWRNGYTNAPRDPGLIDLICQRAVELGIPKRTLFDVSLQVGVHAMRMHNDTIEAMREREYNVIKLSGMDKQLGKRVWAYTEVLVKIRQPMPLPDVWEEQ